MNIFNTFFCKGEPVATQNYSTQPYHKLSQKVLDDGDAILRKFLDSDDDHVEFSIENEDESGETCTYAHFTASKAMINVKTLANLYDQYLSVQCSGWPHIINKWIARIQPDYMLDPKEVVMPNEILEYHYSSHHKYIPLGYKIVDIPE